MESPRRSRGVIDSDALEGGQGKDVELVSGCNLRIKLTVDDTTVDETRTVSVDETLPTAIDMEKLVNHIHLK